jgi:hypothetical protein
MAVATVVGRTTLHAELNRWDADWYRKVVLHGYPHDLPRTAEGVGQSTVAFFPGFPLLVRFVRFVTGLSPTAAATATATTCAVLACILLWVLARRVADRGVADRTVALFAFFPGSLVLTLPYAEPLMLVLVLGCLLCLLERRFLPAGVLAALATATRPNAIVLVACCAFEGFLVLRETKDRRGLGRPIVATALAPLGFLAFMAFLWLRTGHADAWFATQRGGWLEHLSITAPGHWVTLFLDHPEHPGIATVSIGLLFLVVAAAVTAWSRLPGVLHVYTAGIVGLALFSYTLGARPRFLLTAFPLFIGLAKRLPLFWFTITVCILATLLATFTVLTLTTELVVP